MKRPQDKDFSNGPSGVVAYCFALEKYADHLDQSLADIKSACDYDYYSLEQIWHLADKALKE